jgi:AraC family transcriptional regulator
MQPKITTIPAKKLIGTSLTMSFANYRIAELWQNFMPRRKDIQYALNADLISMSLYAPNHFTKFSPQREFEKWACVEVIELSEVPDQLQTFTLPAGWYAVFDYQGTSGDNSIYQYIFGTWLPASEYELDDRPHFEVLGEKYKNNDPASEEEIWVPIRAK